MTPAADSPDTATLRRPSIANSACHMLIQRLRHPFASPADAEGATQGGAVTILDQAALDKLRELDPTGKNQLIARIVKAFEGSVSRLLSQLHEAHGKGDLNGVRHVAHTLKSSSASVGALKLSRICAEVEAMTRQGRSDGLDEHLAEMTTEIPKVQAALRLLADNEK